MRPSTSMSVLASTRPFHLKSLSDGPVSTSQRKLPTKLLTSRNASGPGCRCRDNSSFAGSFFSLVSGGRLRAMSVSQPSSMRVRKFFPNGETDAKGYGDSQAGHPEPSIAPVWRPVIAEHSFVQLQASDSRQPSTTRSIFFAPRVGCVEGRCCTDCRAQLVFRR